MPTPRTLLTLALLLPLATGCLAPTSRGDNPQAQLQSWSPILELDGLAPPDSYQLELEPGEHELLVVYHTYRRDYHCRFRFEARPGMRYEIIDRSNPQPLVLYRWSRQNGLWAKRSEAVNPVACEERAPLRSVQ